MLSSVISKYEIFKGLRGFSFLDNWRGFGCLLIERLNAGTR